MLTSTGSVGSAVLTSTASVGSAVMSSTGSAVLSSAAGSAVLSSATGSAVLSSTTVLAGSLLSELALVDSLVSKLISPVEVASFVSAVVVVAVD